MSTEQPAPEFDLRSVYAGLIAGGLSGAIFGLLFGIGGAYLYLWHGQSNAQVAFPVAVHGTSQYPVINGPPTTSWAPSSPGPALSTPVPSAPTSAAPTGWTATQTRTVQQLPVYESATTAPIVDRYVQPTTSTTPSYTPPTTYYAPSPSTGSLPGTPVPYVPPTSHSPGSADVYYPATTTATVIPPSNYAQPTPPSGYTPAPSDAPPYSPSTSDIPAGPPSLQASAVSVRFYVTGYKESLEPTTFGTPNQVAFQEGEFHSDTSDGFLGYYQKSISSVTLIGATPGRYHVIIADQSRTGKVCEGVMEVEYGNPAKKHRYEYHQQVRIGGDTPR